MVSALFPELIVIIVGLFTLLADVTVRPKAAELSGVVALGLFAALLATVLPLFSPQAFEWRGGQIELLGGRFVLDNTARWFKLIFIGATLFTVILSGESFSVFTPDDPGRSQRLTHPGEFLVLLLLSLLGMMFLVSSRDLVTVYVNLELATVPLILLSAWSHNTGSSEAGLKYVILGALSSVLMLFGMSFLYALAGQMELAAIASDIASRPIVWLALAFLAAGIGFKLAMFPFHMWAPDVYQGAPTPIAAFLSIASKAVGVALVVLLLAGLLGSHLQEWSSLFAVFAALTMTVGNLAAISQHNIKRFMAYSGISQAGYILLGFIGDGSSGFPEVIYYLLGYLVTNCAVFAVIIHVARKTGSEEISSYAGLSERSPFLAVVMMVALFSLAGIPPLAGFTGKFFLFSIAAQAGYYSLVALAAINSTVSLYYYLRIVRQMYIEQPAGRVDETAANNAELSPLVRITVLTVFLATIFIGVCPMFYESIRQQTRRENMPSTLSANSIGKGNTVITN